MTVCHLAYYVACCTRARLSTITPALVHLSPSRPRARLPNPGPASRTHTLPRIASVHLPPSRPPAHPTPPGPGPATRTHCVTFLPPPRMPIDVALP